MGTAAIPPTSNTLATISIGMLGLMYTNSPNKFVPIIAPILAIRRCIPKAVDLYMHVCVFVCVGLSMFVCVGLSMFVCVGLSMFVCERVHVCRREQQDNFRDAGL